jgi:hypothetical protein
VRHQTPTRTCNSFRQSRRQAVTKHPRLFHSDETKSRSVWTEGIRANTGDFAGNVTKHPRLRMGSKRANS